LLKKKSCLGTGTSGNFEPSESIKVTKNTGPGENGKGHHLRVEQKTQEENLKGVYGFNQLVSDEITLNRTVPDLREEECQYWDYPTVLPKASVILVFHNEGWSTLFRTVNSVLNRSPAQFLEEVLLVDDKSELEHLHDQLENELEKPYYKGRVRLVRNTEREGLIRSRNNGAIAARGEVVIFLDAHCEVGYNWLPPLLAPIHADRRTLSVPVIDGIQWDDFSINPVYARNSHSRGLFEWGMLYKEGTVPTKEEKRRDHHSEPYYAPTHAGGLFAINRAWFEELGWYDPGLWVWGGENFELSFKVWMCGGNSVWVPCSRISHVYRGHSCSSCHSGSLANKFGGQPTTLRNYK
jgi:polypeptide N-acetylgalactosaminyltransferase